MAAVFLGIVAAGLLGGVAYVIGPRRVVCPRCAAHRPPLTLVGQVEVYPTSGGSPPVICLDTDRLSTERLES